MKGAVSPVQVQAVLAEALKPPFPSLVAEPGDERAAEHAVEPRVDQRTAHGRQDVLGAMVEKQRPPPPASGVNADIRGGRDRLYTPKAPSLGGKLAGLFQAGDRQGRRNGGGTRPPG